jgi:hypothetical protein
MIYQHRIITNRQRQPAGMAAQPGYVSEVMIAALFRLGDEWSEGHVQDDDITFVMLHVQG